MGDQPLRGVKVVDLTYYIAGPGSAKILADWGADVIKIEPPGGEPGRLTGVSLGLPSTDDINPYFSIWNDNKRDISLNLKTKEGIDILNKLLAQSHVFVTSFRPGALQRLGLDYETMSKQHPHIVWASLNGFGDYGPDKDKAGFDVVAYWARSGAMIDPTEKDTSPLNPTLGFGDSVAAGSLAGGIAAGLYQQAKTGKGTKVIISLLAQGIWNLSTVVASSQVGDKYPKSRKAPNSPVVNSYKTKDDQWMYQSIFDYVKQIPAFLKAIDREDLIGDERFADPWAAAKNSGEFVTIIDEGYAKFTMAEMDERLTIADVAHQKVQHACEVLNDPQAIANNYIYETTHRNGQKTIQTLPPVKFGDIELNLKYPTPICGEHTDEVLKELGYSDDEIKELEAKKVIEIRKYEKK